MSHPLRQLGRAALASLADALDAEQFPGPIRRASVAPHVPDEQVDAVTLALVELQPGGASPRTLARVLRILVEERDDAQRMSDRVELVWSPPELDSVDARDTAVVLQELFRRARESVLISTFALDERSKAEVLFGELAARMDAEPALTVRLLVNIHRKHLDETPSVALIGDFVRRLRHQVWPGSRLPGVFFDPRSLEVDGHKRAVLHAKVVVVDGRWTLLTSANLTEAAQERNIEVGAVIDDQHVARRVSRQFAELVSAGTLRRLDTGGG